jgi:outer membrane protein assembly factor BamB
MLINEGGNIMKNEIFKVCALGLVAVTLVTGCGKNEKGADMTGKEDFISYEEKIENNGPVVVKVEMNMYERTNYGELMIEAKDADGEIVWTKSAGTIADGSDNYSLIAEEGDKYVYMNKWNEEDETTHFIALDKQTGEKVWEVSPIVETITCPTIIENEDKLYVVSGMAGAYSLEIFDLNTGKELKIIDALSLYVEKEERRFDFEEYYDIITNTMKLEGNEIVFDVRDRDDNGNDAGLVGYLKINTENYNVKFDK